MELEHVLLSPGNAEISILSFAEKACDVGERKKFAVLWTKRGLEVPETGRVFKALQENHVRNEKRSRLLDTMERRQKLMSGAPEERNSEESPPGRLGLGRQDLEGGK